MGAANESIISEWFLKEASRLQNLIRVSKYSAIVCHHNADPDALCSAYALKRLIRKVNRKTKVSTVTPDGVAEISKSLMAQFKDHYEERVDLRNFDLLILVDNSSQWMLGEMSSQYEGFQGKVVIVDHHNPDKSTADKATLKILDETYTSTCEIVYEVYRKLHYKMSKKVALSLLIGLIFDTRHFRIADASTLRRAAGLCDEGADVEEAYKALYSVAPRSERIARLKAVQRCKIREEAGWIITTSLVNSHQAAAARTLISLADVAIVAGGKRGELRINLRSTSDFFKATSIHLGRDVAAPIGGRFGGSGGGHDTAAGINATGEPKEGLKACLESILKLLRNGIKT